MANRIWALVNILNTERLQKFVGVSNVDQGSGRVGV
jgi:hypothetical protein